MPGVGTPGSMPIHAGAERSPLPCETVHRASNGDERVDELEVQSVVARSVRHALTNSELEQPADAVKVGVKARYFAEGLRIDGASEANTPQTPAEHFATAAAGQPGKGIEAREVVFIDADGHDAGFGLPRRDMLARHGSHLALVEWARNSKTARASSRDSACRELERTLRANAPKVWAVGVSPTSALPCVVSASVLPFGKTVSRKCVSSCFDSGGSGSGFL